jgi:hypothetical protein
MYTEGNLLKALWELTGKTGGPWSSREGTKPMNHAVGELCGPLPSVAAAADAVARLPPLPWKLAGCCDCTSLASHSQPGGKSVWVPGVRAMFGVCIGVHGTNPNDDNLHNHPWYLWACLCPGNKGAGESMDSPVSRVERNAASPGKHSLAMYPLAVPV